MTTHAKLSPSSAHRWLACPGSVALCDGLPNPSSEHAAEGTMAHELGERWLREGVPINLDPAVEMLDYVARYVEYVRNHAEGGQLYVEQRLPIGHVTGEDGASGTSDAVVISDDGKLVKIIDLKYGRGVEVSADANEQLMLYALGAYHEFELELADDVQFILCIFQPRLGIVSEWLVKLEDLLSFAERVKAQAAKTRIPLLSDDAEFNPGEDQCRWCLAKATCPALAKHVQEVIGKEFDDISEDTNFKYDKLSESYLSRALRAVPLIEDWCKAIRGRVESDLLAGKTVQGFKLVAGRRGARKWSDEAAAEAELKAMRLKKEDMYDFKLISPTSAEKFFKEEPRRWARISPLITQSEGSPSVAPVSDKRPALILDSTNDFETVQ